MIKVYRQLPEIYFHESRDFQALARVYEVTYNYLKTNADVMENLSLGKNFDKQLLEMMSLTVGFVNKHNYNSDDLMNVCSSFAEILKYKGSKRAIQMAVRTLLNAQHNTSTFDLKKATSDSNHLIITLPTTMTDISLLEDLFDYILPAGMTYSFTYADISSLEGQTKLAVTTTSVSQIRPDPHIGRVASYDENTTRFTTEPGEQPEKVSQTSTSVIVGGDEDE